MGGITGAVTWDVVAALFTIGGALVTIVVWIHGRLEGLRRSIDAHKLYAAENYVTKEGMSEGLGRIETALQRIEQRIDGLYQGQPNPPRSGGR